MDIEEILTEWKMDSKIDHTKIDFESLNTPTLHAKYLEMMLRSKKYLQKSERERRKLAKDLRAYFRGEKNNPEDLKELGRPPLQQKIMKTDVAEHVETDDEIVEIDDKIAEYSHMVYSLEEILKSINSRNFTIKNAVDYLRMTEFAQ